MALDPTVGGPNSDSYDTLENFKLYADSIGYDYSSHQDTVIEQKMRLATQYLDRAYRTRWKGFRTDRDQALAWPRSSDSNEQKNYLTPSFTAGVIDEDGYEIPPNVVPKQVKYAQFEATFMSLNGVDLLPRQERGNAIKKESDKAASVETEIEYQSGAPTRDRHLTIEGLLAGITLSQPGMPTVSGQLVRS